MAVIAAPRIVSWIAKEAKETNEYMTDETALEVGKIIQLKIENRKKLQLAIEESLSLKTKKETSEKSYSDSLIKINILESELNNLQILLDKTVAPR